MKSNSYTPLLTRGKVKRKQIYIHIATQEMTSCSGPASLDCVLIAKLKQWFYKTKNSCQICKKFARCHWQSKHIFIWFIFFFLTKWTTREQQNTNQWTVVIWTLLPHHGIFIWINPWKKPQQLLCEQTSNTTNKYKSANNM